MKIEIVDVHVHRKVTQNRFSGTVHIYLPEVEGGVDVRGISYTCRYTPEGKPIFWVSFFNKKSYDHEEKKIINYPCFAFTNLELNKTLISETRKLVEKWFIKNKKEIARKIKLIQN